MKSLLWLALLVSTVVSRTSAQQGETESDVAQSSTFTSHFNFDNREDSAEGDKRRCYVELRILRDSGSGTRIVYRGYGHSSPNHGSYPELRRIGNTFEDCEVYDDQLRAVAVRFHWREGLRRYQSRWVRASSGKILSYVFLKWTDGGGSYDIDDIAEIDMLASSQTVRESATAAKSLLTMYFVHDYAFNVPVRVYISGPHSPASFVVSDDQMIGIQHVDDGLLRALSAFRVDTGELVTLQSYEPAEVSWLLSESICQREEPEVEAAPASKEEAVLAEPGKAF